MSAPRVVAVTGAGRGLGREHALHLADLGTAVVVNDLGPAADEVVAEIVARGGRAVADHSDVSDWAAAKGVIDTALSAFGALHGLVNNAGILRDALLANLDGEDWADVVRVHLTGHAAPLHWAADHWRNRAKAGEGEPAAVVNTTSTSGLLGQVGQVGYGAAKAGIATLSMIAAAELGRYGVRVNCIAPAGRTRLTEDVPGMEDMVRRPDDPEAFDRWDPANVAPVVAYLVGPDCPLTGQTFFVHGGRIQIFRPWWPGPSLVRDQRWTIDELAAELPGFVDAHEEPVPALEGL